MVQTYLSLKHKTCMQCQLAGESCRIARCINYIVF